MHESIIAAALLVHSDHVCCVYLLAQALESALVVAEERARTVEAEAAAAAAAAQAEAERSSKVRQHSLRPPTTRL